MRVSSLLILYCLSCAAHAGTPTRIEAEYDVLVRGIKMHDVHEVFVRRDNQYRIQSVIKPVGLLALFQPETTVITSEGEVADDGLRPHKFTQSRTKSPEKNTRADFDWEHHTLTVSDRAGFRRMPLPAHTQDRLSAMYQFVIVPPRARLKLDLQVTNGSKLQPYDYLLDPTRTVKVPFGEVRSYYLHTPPQATPWKSEIWLAIDHDFFPAKMALTEDNGSQVMQMLRKLDIEP
ncbi:DUF3108 domain-containing protein [Ferrigenium sp. UT5]|uniref:DUF3108 domain-containing protein n=1 Tax=Ferrigenium sp. UT5 TaxID=3242105 RepID=UPI00354E6A58